MDKKIFYYLNKYTFSILICSSLYINCKTKHQRPSKFQIQLKKKIIKKEENSSGNKFKNKTNNDKKNIDNTKIKESNKIDDKKLRRNKNENSKLEQTKSDISVNNQRQNLVSTKIKKPNKSKKLPIKKRGNIQNVKKKSKFIKKSENGNQINNVKQNTDLLDSINEVEQTNNDQVNIDQINLNDNNKEKNNRFIKKKKKKKKTRKKKNNNSQNNLNRNKLKINKSKLSLKERLRSLKNKKKHHLNKIKSLHTKYSKETKIMYKGELREHGNLFKNLRLPQDLKSVERIIDILYYQAKKQKIPYKLTYFIKIYKPLLKGKGRKLQPKAKKILEEYRKDLRELDFKDYINMKIPKTIIPKN